MRPAGCEAQTLRALASMPFLDRTEMVAVTGWSKGRGPRGRRQAGLRRLLRRRTPRHRPLPLIDPEVPPHRRRAGAAGRGGGGLPGRACPRAAPSSAQWRRKPDGTARLPRHDLPAGGRRLRRRIPHTVPVVQGLDPGRRRRAARRPHRRHRQAGGSPPTGPASPTGCGGCARGRSPEPCSC